MNKTFDDIVEHICNHLDHKIDYAQDRSELVNTLINTHEDWLIDLFSDEETRGIHVKNSKSPLTENHKLGKILERIADYILFPKFNTHEDEQQYEYLKEKESMLESMRKELNKAKKELSKDEFNKKHQDIKKQIDQIKDELESFEKTYLSHTMKEKNKVREVLEGTMDKIEEFYGSLMTDESRQVRTNSTNQEIKIDKDYWAKMGFSKTEAKRRQEILDIYEESIDILKEQLGYNIKDTDKREKHIEKLIEYYNKHKLYYKNEYNDSYTVIDGNSRVYRLRKMYGELIRDYNDAKEMLAVPVSFQSPTPSSTEYDFNTDTWYEDDEGNIVEISKNMICFSDPNTYKGFITNYYDLADAYQGKFNTDMWCMLRLFEEILNKAKLTEEEKFVVSLLMKDKTRNEIRYEFLMKFNKDISHKVLSSWINKVIPNKMVETYLESVDDWLYTYWLKGEYKKCSSCGEIKLISNDRYFDKNSHSNDGFHSKCKSCR